MSLFLDDTIAAIVTPLGVGGIGVIRISGQDAFFIANKLTGIESPQPNTAHHVWLPMNIDEVVVTFFKSPKSYTGEDVVEFSCHGSLIVLKRVLGLILEKGARQASRGEFTKRAFLNGKMDLIQAESVLSLISSQVDFSADVSTFQLRGGLSKKIKDIEASLMDILSQIQASIDFPDDVVFDSLNGFSIITNIYNKIEKLLATTRFGKILREGVSVVIIGKPNVGKSSLMNAFLKEERAIVTNIPGTTRDAVIEGINIGGIKFTLIDTAGIRDPENSIEEKGIEITKKSINLADVVLVVLDASSALEDIDRDILRLVYDKNIIKVLNKIDLGNIIKIDDGVFVSAMTGQGIDDLEKKIMEKSMHKEVFENNFENNIVIVSEHQANCLRQAKKALNNFSENIKINIPNDLLALDIQNAIEALSNMLGVHIGEDVLNRIFSDFCIGK